MSVYSLASEEEGPLRMGMPPLALPLKITSIVHPDKYPSSPLQVFPPPMPGARRTLRERCGVTLSLAVEYPFGPNHKGGHTQPHRTHLPRLARRRSHKPRLPACDSSFFDGIAQPSTFRVGVPFPTHSPISALKRRALAAVPATPAILSALQPQPPKLSEPHLQAIIPGVWVVFDGAARAAEEGFSHVVEVFYDDASHDTPEASDAPLASPCAGPSSPSSAPKPAETRFDGATQRLRLALPGTARAYHGRAALALTDAQLRAARDFMAERLPPQLAEDPDQTAVRVLVSVPAGRPTDAMCVVGAYLAFVAGQHVEEVLRCVDDEESVLSVWKGEVSGDEVERVEKIARAWSWLSATVPKLE